MSQSLGWPNLASLGEVRNVSELSSSAGANSHSSKPAFLPVQTSPIISPPSLYGLLNINKPPRWTSRDVINWIAKHARKIKVGHAGTLDPLATGVLIVCLGHATRLVPFLHEFPKTYVATFVLGRRSESDDIDTEVEILTDAPVVTTDQLQAVLPHFIGAITQQPSTFSAVKINGQPAYRKARRGKPIDVPERDVEVHRIVLLEHVGDTFTLEIECGTGTYVRSIGRDIAEACGSSAVMSSLCRTRIGDFTVETAIAPLDVQRHGIADQLLSPFLAVPDRPRLLLTAAETPRIENGNEILASADLTHPSGEVAICDPEGALIALGDYDAALRKLTPRVVLRPPIATFTHLAKRSETSRGAD